VVVNDFMLEALGTIWIASSDETRSSAPHKSGECGRKKRRLGLARRGTHRASHQEYRRHQRRRGGKIESWTTREGEADWHVYQNLLAVQGEKQITGLRRHYGGVGERHSLRGNQKKKTILYEPVYKDKNGKHRYSSGVGSEGLRTRAKEGTSAVRRSLPPFHMEKSRRGRRRKRAMFGGQTAILDALRKI